MELIISHSLSDLSELTAGNILPIEIDRKIYNFTVREISENQDGGLFAILEIEGCYAGQIRIN